MAAPPTKKTKLFDAPDNPDVELIFEQVDHIQEKIERLVDEEADKILEVQRDYISKRKPVFEERNNIIRQIPGFWLKAMLGSPLAILIQTPDDKELLGKYLVDFRVEESQPGTAYRIIFDFAPNSWLKSSSIWKEFRINEDGTEVAISGPVEWHPDKDLMKKRGHGGPESFFMFFANEEQDFEIGNVLKDKIYQNPMMYYSTLELEALNDFDEEDEEDDDDLHDVEEQQQEANGGAAFDKAAKRLRSTELSAKSLEASNHSTTASSQ